MLVGVRLEKHGVKRSDGRGFQLAQQGHQVAASRSAEDSELVLDRDDIHVAGVEEVGSPPVRAKILFFNLEANEIRILIAPAGIIDRHREAPVARVPRGHRLKQVGCERGNTAFARQVVADERDGSNARL